MSSYMFPLRRQNSSFTESESESESAVLEEISAKASFDSHLLKIRRFDQAYTVDKILPFLNSLPLSTNILHLISARLRHALASEMETSFSEGSAEGLLWDANFSIIFACILSRSNMSACWSRICKTLVLEDAKPLSLPSTLPLSLPLSLSAFDIGNGNGSSNSHSNNSFKSKDKSNSSGIISNLILRYNRVYECIYENRILEVINLLKSDVTVTIPVRGCDSDSDSDRKYPDRNSLDRTLDRKCLDRNTLDKNTLDRRFLGFDESLVNAISMAPSEWNLLHHAAYSSSKQMIIELINRGVDITRVDADGRHPLHIACASMNVDAIDSFIDNQGASLLQNIDKDGKTPLDIFLNAIKLSKWHRKVAPLRLLQSLKKLLGVSNALWIVNMTTAATAATTAVDKNECKNENKNEYKKMNSLNNRIKKSSNEYDNNVRRKISVDNMNVTNGSTATTGILHHRDPELRSGINSGDPGSGIRSGTGSVDKHTILRNKLYMILSSIKGDDEAVIIPIVEIARSCPSSQWNISVIMHCIFLSVRQRRFILLSYLLESFHVQLFRNQKVQDPQSSPSLSYSDITENFMAENFINDCLTAAVLNQSSVRAVKLLIQYGNSTLQLRERTAVRTDGRRVCTSPIFSCGALHIAILICASKMVPTSTSSDNNNNTDIGSTGQININSNLKTNLNSKMNFNSNSSSSEKSVEKNKSPQELLKSLIANMKNDNEEKLTEKEDPFLVLQELLKYYRNYDKNYDKNSYENNFENGNYEKNYYGKGNYGENNYGNNEQNSSNTDTTSAVTGNQRILKPLNNDHKSNHKNNYNYFDNDFSSIWSPFSNKNMIEKLLSISPLCLACLTGCSSTVGILLNHVQGPVQDSQNNYEKDIFGASFDENLFGRRSASVSASDGLLNSRSGPRSGPRSDSTSDSRPGVSTYVTPNTYVTTHPDSDSQFDSVFVHGTNPVLCAALSGCPEILMLLKQNMGDILFSKACTYVQYGMTPLSALLYVVKIQSDSYKYPERQSRCVNESINESDNLNLNSIFNFNSSFLHKNFTHLLNKQFDHEKILRTVDILLEGTNKHNKFNRNNKYSQQYAPYRVSNNNNNNNNSNNKSNVDSLWTERYNYFYAQLEGIERRLYGLIKITNLNKNVVNDTNLNTNIYTSMNRILNTYIEKDTQNNGKVPKSVSKSVSNFVPNFVPSLSRTCPSDLTSQNLTAIILESERSKVYLHAKNVYFTSQNNWLLIRSQLESESESLKGKRTQTQTLGTLAIQMR